MPSETVKVGPGKKAGANPVPKGAKPVAKKAAGKAAGKPRPATKVSAPPQVQDEAAEGIGGSGLTPKQQRFVAEYIIDLNGTQAAIRAGYSVESAGAIAHENLTKPEIASAINAAMKQRAGRAELKADDVIGRLRDVAFADPRELCGLHRYGCRYCWGDDHRYQFTEAEIQRAKAEHAKAQQANAEVGAFDAKGGVGFHGKRDPNPDCPECFGDGIEMPYVADTSKVSPEAARLFAGLKVTKAGVEVLMHSQLDAAIQLGRHLGLFNDKLKLSGKVEHDAAAELREFLANRSSRLPIMSG